MKRVFLLILGVPEGLAIAVAAIVLQPADDRLFLLPSLGLADGN